MTEAQLYEKIGRLTATAEKQDEAYSQLLNVLMHVIRGDISRNRVMVNITDRTWSVAKPGEFPATPATINGLPICVVGTDKE